jgi:hypothetical protein
MLLLNHARRLNDQSAPQPSVYRLGRRALFGTMLWVTLLTLSAAPHIQAQTVQLIAVDVRDVAQGYQTSALVGSRVKNDKDETIGTLEDIVITKDRRIFAIVQVGGFLGIGGRLIAVPYDSLQISDDGRKVTLAGATKEALEKLPEFRFRSPA